MRSLLGCGVRVVLGNVSRARQHLSPAHAKQPTNQRGAEPIGPRLPGTPPAVLFVTTPHPQIVHLTCCAGKTVHVHLTPTATVTAIRKTSWSWLLPRHTPAQPGTTAPRPRDHHPQPPHSQQQRRRLAIDMSAQSHIPHRHQVHLWLHLNQTQ